MIAKANIDKFDFGLKKITNNHSHVVFTNEDTYQNYQPDPDTKTKIIQSQTISVWKRKSDVGETKAREKKKADSIKG